MRLSITSFSLLSMAGVLAVGTALAEEPAAAVRKPARAVTSAESATPSPQAVLPNCLQQLNLTAAQQTQIEEIIGDYEVDLTAVWKQFGERYVDSVRAEAMLLSAIEDNLTEPQRNQVREQRRRVARHEKKRAATGVEATPATAKPVSAVEQELAVVGISLTAEQEAAADSVEEKYISRLRSLNRDIQGLHTRLVSLEADKFVEIEKVLTEEQLKQLAEIRQSAPPAAEVDAVQGG